MKKPAYKEGIVGPSLDPSRAEILIFEWEAKKEAKSSEESLYISSLPAISTPTSGSGWQLAPSIGMLVWLNENTSTQPFVFFLSDF